MYHQLKSELRESKKVISNAKLKQSGQVPGVLYSKGMESIPIKVQANLLERCVAKNAHIIELELNGEKHLVSLESVERDVAGQGKLQHVSFHKVQRDQKTTVSIPIVLIKDKVRTNGKVIRQLINEIHVTGKPADICEKIEVDVTTLERDQVIILKDIKLPRGVEFNQADLEKTVVTCSAMKIEEEKPETVATVSIMPKAVSTTKEKIEEAAE